MNQVIIYPSQERANGVDVCFPTDCGLTIEQIAQKDVPAGLPYFIIDRSELPTGNDAIYFDSWEADFSSANTFGANHGIGSYFAVIGYNPDGTPILRQETEIQ